jgi:ribonuclease BN (tRNA processing enzyme)
MRLTVLGSAASYAGPGQACAGHLVETSSTKVLFDCGHGVLANLGKVTDPASVDAIFVTHYHPDHYVDLYGLQSMLRYAPEGPRPAIDVHLPPGLEDRMMCLLSERGCGALSDAFNFIVLKAGEPVVVGDITITALPVDHTVESYALRAEADGVLLAYTADSRPGELVSAAVEGADFVLCEATLPEQYAGMAPHMTASEAGTLAREAGASQLAMIHIWPTNDRAEQARAASEAFGRPAHVASELDSYEIVASKRSSLEAV